ncbi:hypothetical protein ACM16X_02345 [Haloarcula japonica]|uniref:hypothetical protein n=1 Tax=Haloarcula japonica TaxID=29282 RepID=UPI0039F6B63E
MSKPPRSLMKQLAEVQLFLREGRFVDAKEELRTINQCARKVEESNKYWDNLETGTEYIVNWINKQLREGRQEGLTEEEDEKFRDDIGLLANGLEPKYFVAEKSELRGQTPNQDSELAEATEAVKQDQIEFLEEEVRKSEEHLMELKQELNELKEEQED